MMDSLKERLDSLVGQTICNHKIIQTSVFDYTDPVTGDIATNQGYNIEFEDGRIFSRLSGTGSSGATLRLYYSCQTNNKELFSLPAVSALEEFIRASNEILQIKEYTGKDAPNIVT